MTSKSRPRITRRAFMGAATSTTLAGVAEANPMPKARTLGAPPRAHGTRSPFVLSERMLRPGGMTAPSRSSRTPLQDLYGIITPSSLHFERHHSGVPTIEPSHHRLLIHGEVRNPVILSLGDLERFPSVSRVHFIECAGNGGREHAGLPGDTVQKSHGLLSCSEWTGVSLRSLLEHVGLTKNAKWIVAEGADAARHARSITLSKALDDVVVAYGQNGEALRPEQGYPLRLLAPGWEGNVNVKWLHRLHVVGEPAMTRDEAASYTDFFPNGKARHFSFVMEANSVITRPSGGQRLTEQGPHEITGIAWSGRGRIRAVEVSVDGGRTWSVARLQEPIYPKALTRFALTWQWKGHEAVLQSRCVDETGYVQPTRAMLVEARGMTRGPDGFDHYNGIKSWFVQKNGLVSHV